MLSMKKNRLANDIQQNPFVIRILAEQSKEKREYPFYERFHDEQYIQSHDSRMEVKLKEKREDREYHLINDAKRELVVYCIDGGVISKQEAGDNKCDFGIYTEDEFLILVELKGADYKKAIEQIWTTTKTLGIGAQMKVKKLLARVVVSKGKNVPNLLTTDLTHLKKRISEINGQWRNEYILAKSKRLEEILSKL